METLYLLAQPAFVAAWYGAGALSAAWITYDAFRANSPAPTALKCVGPIIGLFLSLPGLASYVLTRRPTAMRHSAPGERTSAFERYAPATFRSVAASVNDSVAGGAVGILIAMVLARIAGFSFWQEFWFEYTMGLAFGWLLFQYEAVRSTGSGVVQALRIAGRAEFFSMMTVMAGMGLVMAVVTPLVVGQQPLVSTAAFWGFAALGLLVGWIATLPMNYWLVRIGWKHGTS